MKNNEQIKLTDFINDAIKVYGLDENDFKPKTKTAYKCSECGAGYDENDKFCSKDGKEIIPYTYEVRSDQTDDNIRDLIYDFTEGVEHESDKNFPYTFIDSVEKRGDGSGYWMNFIFQRKKDKKYFVYTSYDGRIEGDTLDETTKEVTTVWEFEKYFD